MLYCGCEHTEFAALAAAALLLGNACAAKSSCPSAGVIKVFNKLHIWSYNAFQHQLRNAIAFVHCSQQPQAAETDNSSTTCISE
jgi:hypothetical protein